MAGSYHVHIFRCHYDSGFIMVGNNISHPTNLVSSTFQLNILHPNISIHILHTIFFTFPKVLIRRICLTIKSFNSLVDHFFYFGP